MLDFAHPLGDTVKKARIAQGLTQASVAERVAIDSRTIINIENYNGNPEMEVLFPLIRALHIDPWEIFYPELNNQCTAFRHLRYFSKIATMKKSKHCYQYAKSYYPTCVQKRDLY